MTQSTYFCDFFNTGSGKWHAVKVSAASLKEAVEIAQQQKRRKMQRAWQGCDHAEYIIDAENLLFEMDANNCDEITVGEGFQAQETYTRDQVTKSLLSENSIKKYRASKVLSGEII